MLITLFALHIYAYRPSGIKCALNYVRNFMPSFTYRSVLVVVYILVLVFVMAYIGQLHMNDSDH